MSPCFLCGSDGMCGHREPELIAWETRIAEAADARMPRSSYRPPDEARKPPERVVAPLIAINRKV
jgi:hypothetical protein